MYQNNFSELLVEINNNLKNVMSFNTKNRSSFTTPISSDFMADVYENIRKHEEKLMELSVNEGIAASLTLSTNILYELEEDGKIDYQFWLNEEDTGFFSYLQENLKEVYDNEYVLRQFEMMKNNDINLFVPFLLVLTEKLCRKIINKEPDRLRYGALRESLSLEWKNIKNHELFEKEHHTRENITELYSRIFDTIIIGEIFIDESKYNIKNNNNYNRHIIMHAKTDFDNFTTVKTAKLIFVILFLIDILELKKSLKE